MYTEFTKKRVYEQLILAVACFARHRPASGEVSILAQKQKYGQSCGAFIVIMLLNEPLTWVYSQKDPRLQLARVSL